MLTYDSGTDSIVLEAASGGGGGSVAVQEGDSPVVAAASVIDFAAADFDVTESPSGEANIAIAAAIARYSEVTAAISALSSVYQAKDVTLDTYAGIDPSANVQSVLGAANYAAIRTLLALVPGTDVQAFDATLAALAAANWAANALPIGTGADALSQTSFAANTFPARASSGNLVAKSITDFGLSLVDDTDAATARATLGVVAPTSYATGEYYNPPRSSNALAAVGQTQNRMYFTPWWFPPSTSIDRIFVSIATAQASNTFRLGIYQDNGAGKPGSLIVDAGTVSAAASAGVEATVSVTLSGLVWFVAVEQGGAGGAQIYGAPIVCDHSNTASGNMSQWYSTSTSISGALPDPAGAVTEHHPGANHPWFQVRKA